MTASNKSVACMLQRRAKLLHKDNKTVPAYNEAISNLGSFLGETVLNEMSPLAKGLMGLDEPLPVAPKVLWLSPTDRIDGEIIIKPPPFEDAVKALTHEGILEIGTVVEERFEKYYQETIKKAKKEVEDFERFECNNRIKFALQEQQLAHEIAFEQQRSDLMKIFQKDREDLIEENKIELKTIKRNLASEHKLMTDRIVRMSVEQIRISTDEKINELTEQNNLLKTELEKMKKMVTEEVEKRKQKDCQILREMHAEIHRQYTTKLQILHHQHNVEIRQLYLKIRTNSMENEDSCYEDNIWEDESLSSASEKEIEEKKPFVINLCKVQGESCDEQSSMHDTHSNCSSFKCDKHRSKPIDGVPIVQGPVESTMCCSRAASIPNLNDVNTTDVSCNILRRLGLNFNVANIEKVKVEVDNLLMNASKKGETELLAITDSLELITADSKDSFSESKELDQRQPADVCEREKYKRLMNGKKSQEVLYSKLGIPLTTEEYLTTLTPIPKYMAFGTGNISIWDYKVMSDEEWNDLLHELDSKVKIESSESQFRNKTVTVTSPNSEESLIISERCIKRHPSRGILRPSVENKMNSNFLETNEIFQTNEMRPLVKKLCQ